MEAESLCDQLSRFVGGMIAALTRNGIVFVRIRCFHPPLNVGCSGVVAENAALQEIGRDLAATVKGIGKDAVLKGDIGLDADDLRLQ